MKLIWLHTTEPHNTKFKQLNLVYVSLTNSPIVSWTWFSTSSENTGIVLDKQEVEQRAKNVSTDFTGT
jgi:hypothetical protein